MLKVDFTEVYGFRAALRGLRNPYDSWEKSDSEFEETCGIVTRFKLGEKDADLCKRMNASSEQSKYRRMIIVWCDIIAPLYWWKEYDTYKVGTVANSCSTMHTIHKRELEASDFSFDRSYKNFECAEVIDDMLYRINRCRDMFLKTNDKDYWKYMIELLPTSFNQRRTVKLNYEVLAQIYRQRRFHKLEEWHTFCAWIETLPYAKELIIGDAK